MLALILSLTLQVPAPSITFAAPAGQAAQVLEALSKSTGKTLKISGPIKDETILIDVHDIPLSTLKDRLAYVIRAEWEPLQGGGEVLARTNKQQHELEQAEYARRVAALKNSQEAEAKKVLARGWDADRAHELVKEMADLYAQPDTEQRVQETFTLKNQVPFERFLRRFAMNIPAEHLVNIPVGEQAIFCSKPRAGQLDFPPGTEELIQTLFKEQDLLLDAPRRKEGLTDPWFAAIVSAPDLRHDCARLLIHVSHYYSELYSLDAEALDAKNEGIAFAFEALPVWNRAAFSDATKARAALKLKEAELPSMEQEFLSHADRWIRGAKPQKIDVQQALLDRIEHPESYDPLSLGAGGMLDEIARQANLQVVAVVPDELEGRLFMTKGKPNLMNFLSMAERSNEMNFEDGWMTLRPLDCVEELTTKGNRQSLGNYIRKILVMKTDTLDDAGAFHYNQPGRDLSPYATHVLTFLHATGYDETYWPDLTSDDFLWLYGSLSAFQKGQLNETGSLPLSQLTPEQARCIPRLLTDAPDFGSLYEDASEAFVDGPPTDGALTMRQETDMVVEAALEDGSLDRLTVGEIGVRLAMAERKESNWQLDHYKSFTPIYRASIVYRFEFPRENVRATMLHIPTLTAGDTVAKIEDLPKPYLDAIRHKQAEARVLPRNALLKLWGTLRYR